MLHSSCGGEYPPTPRRQYGAVRCSAGRAPRWGAGRDLRLVHIDRRRSLVDVSLWSWLAVLGVIVGMLAVDLFAHRRAGPTCVWGGAGGVGGGGGLRGGLWASGGGEGGGVGKGGGIGGGPVILKKK